MAYGFAAFGVSLNYFYCCGKLKEVSLKLHPPVDGCKMNGKKDCCKNKTVSVKLNTDQQHNQQIVFEPVLFSTAITNNIFFETSLFSKFEKHFTPYLNGPPPLPLLGLHILHNSFLI